MLGCLGGIFSPLAYFLDGLRLKDFGLVDCYLPTIRYMKLFKEATLGISDLCKPQMVWITKLVLSFR